ncbi:hypothetical protein GCM10010399_73030 [Dactylosporangium fulvum]
MASSVRTDPDAREFWDQAGHLSLIIVRRFGPTSQRATAAGRVQNGKAHGDLLLDVERTGAGSRGIATGGGEAPMHSAWRARWFRWYPDLFDMQMIVCPAPGFHWPPRRSLPAGKRERCRSPAPAG